MYEAVKELDSGKGLYPESVKELHWATELALCAIKQMAHSSLIAVLVAMKRHLWLKLSGIREKEKSSLLDTPLLPPGLCINTVNKVLNVF